MDNERSTKIIDSEKSPNRDGIPTTTTASTVPRIKCEPSSSSDEMKEFAETAMNELLGWYGYDGGVGCDGDTDPEHRIRTRSGGDSSGPEFSDSGGGSASSGGVKKGSETAGTATSGWWCGWCSRPMPEGGCGSSATGAFCSELCFSQSRRASFKKNRTCDWCRHVRHSVAHVDVRDGLRHLQFCSDKCLNQYKMHIFCRETQAHLELLNPHPAAATTASAPRASVDSPLITPDLWLRDCREMTSPVAASSLPPPSVSSSGESTTRRRRTCAASRRATRPTTTIPVEVAPEVPQDLRVRPSRSPTPTAPATHWPSATHWPPPPPPLTVLVPYPVVVPIPIPLPLPIPIPISEAMLKRVTDAGPKPAAPAKQPKIVTTDDKNNDNKPVTRILRKRKRPTDSVTASTNSRSNRSSDSQSRKTVPA